MTCAQVSLVLEGYGARQVMELEIGEEMIYKLEGDKLWSNAVITALDLETNRIFFEYGSIAIGDVRKVKRIGRKRSMRRISNLLYIFGAQWLGYGAVWSVLNDEPMPNRDLLIPAGAATLASGFRLFSGNRKYSVGRSKRLRISDVRWQVPSVP